MASRMANVCIIPEMPFSLPMLLDHVLQRVRDRGHAVVVVAEGVQLPDQPDQGTDASGNRVLADIGRQLKDALLKHFKEAGVELNLKVRRALPPPPPLPR